MLALGLKVFLEAMNFLSKVRSGVGLNFILLLFFLAEVSAEEKSTCEIAWFEFKIPNSKWKVDFLNLDRKPPDFPELKGQKIDGQAG